MQRWQIVIVLAAMTLVDAAAAATRPEPSFLDRLFSAFASAPLPRQHHAVTHKRRVATTNAAPAQGIHPAGQNIDQGDIDPGDLGIRPSDEDLAPATAEPAPELPPAVAGGCGAGQRIKSAYYWEGRRTASGEPFNADGLTAAHRTLPFGTRLTVTNPRTGQSVSVVVNDRGPYVRGVSLDLSRGAARAIGMRGTEHVCVS